VYPGVPPLGVTDASPSLFPHVEFVELVVVETAVAG